MRQEVTAPARRTDWDTYRRVSYTLGKRLRTSDLRFVLGELGVSSARIEGLVRGCVR